MVKLQRITSPKHPGAIFFKEWGTKDNFIAKFYPGKEREAELFQHSMNHEEAVRVSVEREYNGLLT
jgi:hypothetical protein